MFDTIVAWLGGWIAIFGVITGAGAVYFLAKNDAKYNWFGLRFKAGTLGWTLGIINAAFFMILFGQQLLYADFTLNFYYFFTSALGLYWWKFRTPKVGTDRSITSLSKGGWAIVVAVVLIGTVLFGTFLGQMTIAQFVYIDSFTTVLSFVAQYLLARKVIDNWYLWIVADVIDIGLYAVKGLFSVVAMTAVYMVFCVMGIIRWRKNSRATVSELAAS